MRPIIIVCASLVENEGFLKLSRAYTEAVDRAGGIAVFPDCAGVGDIPRLLDIAGGVLLSGGGDIDPVVFGEEPIREIGEISPMRDAFEIELAKRAAARRMPILGICRGAQILNAAFGGSVYQDINSQIKTPVIKHSQLMPGRYASHFIKTQGETLIRKILGADSVRVNSFHHQAVRELGEGLFASAFAADGVIEAVEHKEMPFCLGVQWHPERMAADNAAQHKIFKEFIKEASNNM